MPHNPDCVSRRVPVLAPVTALGVVAASLGLVSTAAGDPTDRPLRDVARAHLALRSAPTTTTSDTTTTTVAPTTTTVAVTSTTAPSTGLPPYGQATAYGCGPALAYLRAYAAPAFRVECPGDALGHEGMTCYSEAPCAPGERLIAVAVPCPAAYMNEAHNSWVLQHEVEGTPIPDGNPAIDPYGHC